MSIFYELISIFIVQVYTPNESWVIIKYNALINQNYIKF